MNTLQPCAVDRKSTSPSIQFTLRSVMLVVTWSGIGLALVRPIPVLAIVYFLVTTPAILRTWRLVRQDARCSRPLAISELTHYFLGSLWMVVTMAVLSLLVLLGAAACACLAVIAIVARVCQAVRPCLARGQLTISTMMCRSSGLVAGTGRLCRRLRLRPRTLRGIVAIPGQLLAAGLATFLFVLMIAAWVIGFAVGQLGRLFTCWRGLLVLIWTQTMRLIAIDGCILRRFQQPSAGSACIVHLHPLMSPRP